ncbi:hypothetical protein PAPYR_10796 [Paratrimastix pyriformis]|uniref:Uncharacterized protein n=1 Tax=Paratrimastix pyriformis TaxID=342808 RepID=A0ABQ8UAZ1_9EUKA|nr:hypothetical protein PAPYR_10796 [Paratrimastix pyriformis]
MNKDLEKLCKQIDDDINVAINFDNILMDKQLNEMCHDDIFTLNIIFQKQFLRLDYIAESLREFDSTPEFISEKYYHLRMYAYDKLYQSIKKFIFTMSQNEITKRDNNTHHSDADDEIIFDNISKNQKTLKELKDTYEMSKRHFVKYDTLDLKPSFYEGVQRLVKFHMNYEEVIKLFDKVSKNINNIEERDD